METQNVPFCISITNIFGTTFKLQLWSSEACKKVMTLYGLYDQGKAFLKGNSADLMILLYLLDDNQYIYTAAHWIQVFHSLQVPRVQLEDFLIKQSFDLERVRNNAQQHFLRHTFLRQSMSKSNWATKGVFNMSLQSNLSPSPPTFLARSENTVV